MESQITSFTIVWATIYSGADHRKHQSPASLAFVRGISGEFPAQNASDAENVSISWRHHWVTKCFCPVLRIDIVVSDKIANEIARNVLCPVKRIDIVRSDKMFMFCVKDSYNYEWQNSKQNSKERSMYSVKDRYSQEWQNSKQKSRDHFMSYVKYRYSHEWQNNKQNALCPL